MLLLDRTQAALHSLGERARSEKPDLTPAIGVLNDIGRALSSVTPRELRLVQASIASVRERLRYDGGRVDQKPFEALRGADSHAFLAGALWAANEIVGGFISIVDEAVEQRWERSDRAALRMRVIDWLRQHEVGTPSDFIEAFEARGATVRRDQLSRALGDLLRDGLVRAADPPAGADRRNRFYALGDGRRSETDVVVEDLAEASVKDVLRQTGDWKRTRAAFDVALRATAADEVDVRTAR